MTAKDVWSGMTVRDFLRKRLLERAGIMVGDHVKGAIIPKLRESEWSKEFEELMRNRLVMGAFRYDKMRTPGKPQYDRIESCLMRLRKFQETGNLEHLVDVANLCLMEFVEGCHPKKHFSSTDDGEHTKEKS